MTLIFILVRFQYPVIFSPQIPEHTPRFLSFENDWLYWYSYIWGDCLERFGGPFLFGAFTNADAMYAPVVSRFETYGIEVDRVCRAYMDDVLTLPAFEKWYGAAEAETWIVEADEVGPGLGGAE